MNLKHMTGTWEAASKSANVLLTSNLILSVLVACLLVFRSNDHERIVLLPPTLNAKASVGWASADAEYLKGIGAYIAVMSGNVTPKNATFVADVLSGLLDPSIYAEVRRKILMVAQDPAYAKTGGSVSFEIDRVLYDADTKKVFVVGKVVTRNAGAPAETTPVVNEYGIEIRSSKPVVTSINNYPGDQPRTAKWLQENKTLAAALAASAAAESNKDQSK